VHSLCFFSDCKQPNDALNSAESCSCNCGYTVNSRVGQLIIDHLAW